MRLARRGLRIGALRLQVLASADSEPSQRFLRAFRCAGQRQGRGLRRMRAGVLGIAFIVLSGCATPSSPSPTGSAPIGTSQVLATAGISAGAIPLSVSNETSIAVDLLVNGAVVATVAPGAEIDVPTSELPARPWAIETRSPSGRVLSSLSVATSDYYDRLSGMAVRADLSCGRIDVWLGPPMLGPAFVPGPSGDCQ